MPPAGGRKGKKTGARKFIGVLANGVDEPGITSGGFTPPHPVGYLSRENMAQTKALVGLSLFGHAKAFGQADQEFGAILVAAGQVQSPAVAAHQFSSDGQAKPGATLARAALKG